MSIFHPLEVVGRGSEPQLQVGEKICWTYSAMLTLLESSHLFNIKYLKYSDMARALKVYLRKGIFFNFYHQTNAN